MPQGYGSIIWMVGLFVMMYFMMIRPQKKKDQETKNMRNSLAAGDEVITIGGIHGKIVKVNDETITLEVSQNKQKIEFSKWAVGSVNKKSKEAKESKAQNKIEADSQKEEIKTEENKTEDEA